MADPCSVCGGRGWIDIDDLTVKECVCRRKIRLRAYLGDEIALSPIITTSPLFVVENGIIKDDLTNRNVFIESSWRALLPHLKLALINKGPSFYYRIVTDEKVKRVFVGSMHYSNRARKDREEVEYYNSLDDLMGEVCDLVILRFGVMQYSNRSAAGATHEALMIREVLRKPTWIVSTPNMPFENCHAYSPELGSYIDRRFKKISIDSSHASDDVAEGLFDPTEGMSIEEPEEPPHEELALAAAPLPTKHVEGSRDDSIDLMSSSILGGGDTKRKKFKTRKSYD